MCRYSRPPVSRSPGHRCDILSDSFDLQDFRMLWKVRLYEQHLFGGTGRHAAPRYAEHSQCRFCTDGGNLRISNFPAERGSWTERFDLSGSDQRGGERTLPNLVCSDPSAIYPGIRISCRFAGKLLGNSATRLPITESSRVLFDVASRSWCLCRSVTMAFFILLFAIPLKLCH